MEHFFTAVLRKTFNNVQTLWNFQEGLDPSWACLFQV